MSEQCIQFLLLERRNGHPLIPHHLAEAGSCSLVSARVFEVSTLRLFPCSAFVVVLFLLFAPWPIYLPRRRSMSCTHQVFEVHKFYDMSYPNNGPYDGTGDYPGSRRHSSGSQHGPAELPVSVMPRQICLFDALTRDIL